MSDSILDSAYKEREVLLDELKKNKTYQKLELIEGIISTYGGRIVKAGGLNGSKKTLKDTVDDTALDCIKANGGSASKADIQAKLTDDGTEMTNANLAAYLSASNRVTFDGKAKAWVALK